MIFVFFVLSSLFQIQLCGFGETLKEIEIPIPEENCEVKTLLKAGTQKPGIIITLLFADGKKTIINAHSASSGDQKDAFIEFPELRIKYYIRPNLNFYQTGEKKDELIKNWEILPAASSTFFPFSIKKIGSSRIEFWINGNYAGFNEIKSLLKKITVKANGDAEIKDCMCEKISVDSKFLMLDITTHSNPGIMRQVNLPFKNGIQYVNGIPFIIGNGENFDLGKVKNYAKTGYEIDQYFSRSPFDGLSEFLHYSVPLNQYIRAYILCAVEDTREKEPVLTARLTRYIVGGRGDAIADTTIWMTGEKGNIKKVGTIKYIDDKGNEKTTSLFLAEVFLKVGEIQDLIYDMGGNYFRGVLPQPYYLDFEILGKTGLLTAQWDFTHKPSTDTVSSVHIFGITLEESPVMMKVMPSQVGNIYQKNERAEMLVHLLPKKTGKYILGYEISDIEDKPVSQWKQEIICENEKSETMVIPLKVKENGWYAFRIGILDSNNRLLIDHPSSFAILPEDTRRYGYESPFGTWWFGNAHFGTANPEIIGPLFLKAGLRHSCFAPAWHGSLSEKEMAPWKVTAFQVRWWSGWKPDDNQDVLYKNYETRVSEFLKSWPNCKQALIFHESYGGNTIPPELYNATPQPADEKKNKEIENLMKIASVATRVLREKFPDIKIVFGNCNSVSDLAAEFFRRGYPVKNIDYLGIEAAAQTWMPEKPIEWGTQAAWFVRETARKFGYEIPVTSCYEWIYRQDRILGKKTQAEWYTRDALIALAYRFPTISLALLYDVGNCYYNTLWGASGLMKRYPLLYPKPSYVAISTLTRILDSAEFVRRVPTGSLTLYAPEFKKGSQYIYAIWTARGSCDAVVSFGKDERVLIEDMYGRSKTVFLRQGDLKFDAGTSVKYIVSESPVKEIVAGKRQFEENKGFVKPTVVNSMESISEWELIKEKDNRLEAPKKGHTPLRTLGNYTIKEVVDAEMGRCLELELIPEGNVPEIMNEYALLKLKKPVNVVGKPTTIGVWVKGNSSWARVMWEIEDAEGKTLLSCGTDGWGCDILDWPGTISINFDGWCFLQFPITKDSPLQFDRTVPGGVSGQWKMTGKTGNKQIVYPIKIKGIAVEMTRKTLDITEFVPVKNLSIRLKNLSVY
ncbi:MAG: hypothetical protein N2115_00185 [bacterium]|nr:hypothetical protein [bacterium]